MGWSLRKSFGLLPGIRLNLSKSGPRISIGVPGARASFDVHGKGRIYGGTGPIRFQKQVHLGASTDLRAGTGGSFIQTLKRLFGIRS